MVNDFSPSCSKLIISVLQHESKFAFFVTMAEIWILILDWINSSPPSVAYMRQWTRSGLVQGNGLSPLRRKAITRTNAGLLSVGRLETNFREIPIRILSFSLKMHLKLSSTKMAVGYSGIWSTCMIGCFDDKDCLGETYQLHSLA